MQNKLTKKEPEEYGLLRKYKEGDMEAWSVTSIIGFVFGVSDFIVKWSVKVAANRMWKEVLEAKADNKTPSKKRLIELAEQERIYLFKQSGIKGTIVHNGVDKHLETGKEQDIHEDFKGYYQAAINFITKENVIPILREQKVFNKYYGYAGRFDLYAELWGRKVLIDFKTSHHLSSNYGLQLAAYAACLGGLGYRVDRCYILHLKEDGNYTLVRYQDGFQDFLDVLKVFNRKVLLDKPKFNWASDAEVLRRENEKKTI